MVNSDSSDIDVCTVDDDFIASHTGLTVVAAETYIETDSELAKVEEITLTSKDLLTKAKMEQITKEKQLKRKEKLTTQLPSKIRIDQPKHKPNEAIGKENKGTDSTSNKSIVQETEKPNKDDCNESSGQMNTGKRKLIEYASEEVENDFIAENDGESDSDLLDTGVSNELNKFTFESDHLAIKNNRDYQKLLKTLAVLEAQKIQAIKDFEELRRLKDIALKDPLDFVKKIQEKQAPEFPRRQQIVKLPEINWVHYLTAYTDDKIIPQITTRNSLKDADIDLFEFCEAEEEAAAKEVEKPIKAGEKHGTFNQKWSVEEQEKLEKLLVLYPPEEVEARRWEKIAKALGTRTAQQVSSRIQKYFLKLAKAKLPIPGRAPTASSVNSMKKKLNPISYKRSTFFPSWQPSVYMKDDESCVESGENPVFENLNVSDEEDIPLELRDTPEYKELLELKKIKKFKSTTNEQDSSGPAVHRGFMCDGCSVDPIVGVRWHCLDCPSENSVDFCNNCYQKSFENEIHRSTHNLVPLDNSTEANVEDGYTSFEQKKFKYNYLDPNFLPS